MTAETTIRANGFAEMAFTGDAPWHRNGNELEVGAPIEAWLTAAGMDWRAMRARVRYATARDQDSSEWREYDDRVVIFRSDTGAPMGVVSDAFNIVQPQATLEFFRDLVENAGMQLSTAGTLFGGKKFWAMATLPVDSTVALDKRDAFKLNLLLATAVDGSMATEGSWIATRVVCNNTLQIGRREKTTKVKINHRSKFDSAIVKTELGVGAAKSEFERTMEVMRHLAETPMTPTAVINATAELMHPGYAELDLKEKKRVLNSKPVITIGRLAIDNRAVGGDYDGTQGTAYGWLNSVTEYVDHAGRARTPDARLNSAWFGAGAELKERALTLAEVIASTNATFDKPVPSSLLDHVIAETAAK